MSQVITMTLIIELKRPLNHTLKVKLKISWFIQREIKTKTKNSSNDSL